MSKYIYAAFEDRDLKPLPNSVIDDMKSILSEIKAGKLDHNQEEGHR